jgi:hypothetical protein
MDAPQFMLAALAIISTFAFASFFIHRITSLARLRMERKYGTATPEQLAQLDQMKSLTDWKTKAEQRLRVLEQIVSEEDLPTREEIKPLLDNQMNVKTPDGTRSSKIPNQLRNH